MMTISAAAFAAVISLAASVSANEPCKTCGNGVTPTLAPKPVCDNKIYPLSEYHYYKRYCGPVISPNATYGYFQTQWRPWDGGNLNQNANCAAVNNAAAPALAAPAPAPALITPTVPEQKKAPSTNVPNAPTTPMTPAPTTPAPRKLESLPSPNPSGGKGRLNRIGTAGPVSPGVYLLPSNQ
ncbi:MAG: hypothetical protein U0798_10295 [Gemmataceae bacterium]